METTPLLLFRAKKLSSNLYLVKYEKMCMLFTKKNVDIHHYRRKFSRIAVGGTKSWTPNEELFEKATL
jgi:hypothetical protein